MGNDRKTAPAAPGAEPARGQARGTSDGQATLLLVDGNSVVNRAYYAFQQQSRLTSSGGMPTHAIFGFLNILNKYVDELAPTHVCVAFDMRAPTFRHERYDAYKATRKGMPDDLAAQLPQLKEAIDALGYRRAECERYEADDILGTLSRVAEESGAKAVIVTGDRDALQLVSDMTTVMLPVTRSGRTTTETYGAPQMLEAYGVSPSRFIDVKALMGDSSDNIPGVPGVGEKTALALVKEHGGLDEIYADLGAVARESVRKKLAENKEIAYLSKWLATIDRHAPCGLTMDDLVPAAPRRAALYRLFVELGFQTFILKMGLTELDLAEADSGVGVGPDTGSGAGSDAGSGVGAGLGSDAAGSAADVQGEPAEFADADEARAFILRLADALAAAAASSSSSDVAASSAAANAAADGASDVAASSDAVGDAHLGVPPAGSASTDDGVDVALWPLFEKHDGFNPALHGLAVYSPSLGQRFGEALGLQPGARYIPLARLFGADGPAQLGIWRALRPLLYSPFARLVSHDSKQLCHWAFRYGEPIATAAPGSPVAPDAPDAPAGGAGRAPCPSFNFDTMLAAYVVDSAVGRYDIQSLCMAYLGEPVDAVETLLGKGKAKRRLADVPERELSRVAMRLARACLSLVPPLGAAIRANGQDDLYFGVELPLSEVLASMEAAGFYVDTGALTRFSAELDGKIQSLARGIWDLAGEEFNINSPKQLGAVLFEKLGLTPYRKTKTGYSTDADALDGISGSHEIAAKVVEYRQHVKLKSTYADALPALVNPETGRVHTTLNQCVTATGRISSAEPNLQNIPVRLALGREIRRTFMPQRAGDVLLGADYSQIELRVLAHMSGDEAMADAFRSGADIHASTAAKVFGVPEGEVTPEMRTRAKAVNFGIVYGIGDFSLAKDIGVSRKEARAYIDGYLAQYEGVRRFMADAVEEGRRRGYATTIMNRRRSLPELSDQNYNTRAFGERVAMNTPVQGSAADIIKVAMVRAYRAFARSGLASAMILQVHDELIVEARPGELAEAARILRDAMEHAVCLSVPLTADVYSGPNWKDIKRAAPMPEAAGAPEGRTPGAGGGMA